MERFNVWESLVYTGFIALRYASVELATEYWQIVHTFEAENKKAAEKVFREMGGEP
jgi:hypothetical protein